MAIWSAIRHKLENEYLSGRLRGHIRYFATTYRESHDQEGRAAIYYDGQEVIAGAYYHRDHPMDWYPEIETDEVIRMGAFDQRSFYAAFHDFDNQSIEESLKSSNLLIPNRVFHPTYDKNSRTAHPFSQNCKEKKPPTRFLK